MREFRTFLIGGFLFAGFLFAGCCGPADPGDLTGEEIALIRTAGLYSGAGGGCSAAGDEACSAAGDEACGAAGDGACGAADGEACGKTPAGTMRVLTIADRADSLLLRDTSRNFSAKALLSEEYAMLCSLMVATVTHPTQDGVGIAGPQVGLNRRVVAVQRFDKEGEPFEVYPNIRIIWASDSLAYGPEGCLSVPDMRGEVLRSQEVIIEYADMERLSGGGCGECAGCEDASGCDGVAMAGGSRDGLAGDGLAGDGVAGNGLAGDGLAGDGLAGDGLAGDGDIPMRRDTIKGFTAVIFQHETDHLDGILYIDRL